MAFFEKVSLFVSLVATVIGGGIIINGIINIGEGQSQQNVSKQDEGMKKLVVGSLIIIVCIRYIVHGF